MSAVAQYSSILFVGSGPYLDLAKNELRNARIQNLASAPSSPVSGQFYYDTGTNTLQVHNGTAFSTLIDGQTAQSKSGQLTLTGGLVVNTTGITGNKEINLTGTGASSVAGNFTSVINVSTGLTGATAASRYVGGTASAAPASGTFAVGDFVISQTGDIYVCTGAGTPGTWVRVGSYLLGATNTWTASNTYSNGIVANSAITGNGTINLTGTGAGSVGGTFTGTAIVASGLTGATSASRYVGATASAAPASGTFAVGDFAIGQNGSIFICTSAGSPGTWVTLASAGTIYYQTVQNASVSQTQRPRINFLAGTYTSKTVADNSGNTSTDITYDVVPANITPNMLGAATADWSMNTHKITNLLDPTSAQDAATKNYVDLMRQGIEYKDSVQAATTGALPNSPTYSNGTSGVGATLTAGSNVAFPSTLDGVTTALNMRVLVKDQASGLQNGIYVLSAVGSGAAPWVLTRATDNDSTTSTPPRMTAGDVVFVDAGTVNGGVLYAMNQTAAITMGSTAITYTAISGATTITAGAGLTATGNVYAVGAGTGISVAADTVSIDTTVVVRYFNAGTGPGTGATSWAITHGLGNRDVMVNVYDASTYATVQCDVVRTSTTVVTLNFDSTVSANALRAIIMG